MKKIIPTYDDVLRASERIKPFAKKTPVLTSKSINELCNADIFFKCENFQKVGAFKFRGAVNAIFSLNDEQASKGVATHSSGNHAQALALAATIRGIPATIVMPENSSRVKIDAVIGYGAEVVFCQPTLKARETTLEKVIIQKGSTFIHPYDNYNVIAGAGTSAKELIEEVPNLDYVIAPVGGGGLLSGTSISVKALLPDAKVIAAEPEGADDAFRSLQSGAIVPSLKPNTICDGLLTSLSERTFKIISQNVSEIVTLSDEDTIRAMKLIWERMKIIVEPSSATALGILLGNKIDLKAKRIGIILSGGNVDLQKLPW
ncbi:pyridoxal-phosphate dependent enzyme [Bacteroidetes/Chlorobi group bacterium ChocPot_Mid]|jgi:threonine dehydratase|nr:MAG: pyridoxal-phosphate dependent enzyme [Bacteroidetes/Chlorobi group bacterium ChocPot_Mid]